MPVSSMQARTSSFFTGLSPAKIDCYAIRAVCGSRLGRIASLSRIRQRISVLGVEEIGQAPVATIIWRLGDMGRLRFRELISLPGDPDIERRQQKNAEHQVGNQAAYNDDRERPLRIRSDVMR